MREGFHLRPPHPDEAEKLADLGRGTFVETFGHLYRTEDLQHYLAENYRANEVAAEIADPALQHQVIEHQDQIVGFIKLGPLHLPVDEPLPQSHEIRQLYLRQAFTGRGLGKQLMTWADGHLKEHGISNLYLSVFSENHGAIRFYENLGFRKCGEYLYPVGGQLDLEFIMVRTG